MTALALVPAPEPDRRRCHATREEYFAWVRATFADAPASIKSRRYFYNRFLKHWPDLEDWFAEPLLVRLDLHGRDPHELLNLLVVLGQLSYLLLQTPTEPSP